MVEPLPLLLKPLGLLLTLRVLPLVLLPSCYINSLSQPLLAAEAPPPYRAQQHCTSTHQRRHARVECACEARFQHTVSSGGQGKLRVVT